MNTLRKSIFLILLYESVTSIGASKCPEARKPHVTSCTIFYNCINLPEGGYVWAPAKCSDGLVFQPYLRICVLPGDTWTCDNLSTESTPISKSHESPELIDPSETSYLENTQNSSPFIGGSSIGESYPVDGMAEYGNQQLSATPHPLIEIEGSIEKDNNDDDRDDTMDVPQSQSIRHTAGNYLYQFFTSQRKIPLRNDEEGQESHFTSFNGFINNMLLYENVRVPTKQHIFTTREPSAENYSKKNDNIKGIDSDVLNYLVRNYILGVRRSLIAKSKKKIRKSQTTTSKTIEADPPSTDEISRIAEISSEQESSIESIIDGLKPDNNIIGIRGNLGGKEYVTIARYKSLAAQVSVDAIGVLECTKGIRLPNRTDCTKYYTCDPETATVVEFSCSSKTAFDDYNRVCDSQKYKTCVKRRLSERKASTTVRPIQFSPIPTPISTTGNSVEVAQAPDSSSPRMEYQANGNPCESAGKFADTSSEKHYYVCFSSIGSSGSMDFIRMACPNNLIFCQEKRVCTARRRCND